MKNVGSTTWTELGDIRLGSQSTQDNLIWGLNRVRLGAQQSVHPGEFATFSFKVRAPEAPGTYNFRWKMLRENLAWFGELSPGVVIQVR